MTDRLEKINARIREAGGRATATRQAIVETMLDYADHVTADALAEVVRRRFPSINRSTVYRTLAFLEGIGVIDHVHLGHGRAVYHLADKSHHHLVCEGCASVTEIPISELRSFEAQLQINHGFTVNTRHFAIVGRCERCN